VLRGVLPLGPIAPELDAALDESWLTVVWSQEDLDHLITDFATAAVHGLAWDDLAEDTER
jgi:hypothetical protein